MGRVRCWSVWLFLSYFQLDGRSNPWKKGTWASLSICALATDQRSRKQKAQRGSGRHIPSRGDPHVPGTWWDNSHLREGWGVQVVHSEEVCVDGPTASVSSSTPA